MKTKTFWMGFFIILGGLLLALGFSDSPQEKIKIDNKDSNIKIISENDYSNQEAIQEKVQNLAPKGCQCIEDLDCPNFKTHDEAQECFEYCNKIKGYDYHRLDRDEDDLACETLPRK